jgi:hypothetical protein
MAFQINEDALNDDLAEFRARVEDARINRLRDTIHNSSHRHAAVLIENLFLVAQSNVRILCRCINPIVYANPGVIEAAEKSLARKDARIDILVEHKTVIDSGDHPFVRTFEGRAGFSITPLRLEADPGFDFVVADMCAYRLEPNPDEPIARSSFNRPDLARALVEVFEKASIRTNMSTSA